jgi:putative toxin-antitoxin system antitoxin component (TIGR02293 family)
MPAIFDVLGSPGEGKTAPGSTREWVERISAGLPVGWALAFKRSLGLTNEELAALLGVSTRSLARWDPARGRLDSVAGDRLYRVARLFDTAVAVLESHDAAVRWLRSPQRALGGAVPLDLATTDVGTRAVEALLGRMEHGVYT